MPVGSIRTTPAATDTTTPIKTTYSTADLASVTATAGDKSVVGFNPTKSAGFTASNRVFVKVDSSNMPEPEWTFTDSKEAADIARMDVSSPDGSVKLTWRFIVIRNLETSDNSMPNPDQNATPVASAKAPAPAPAPAGDPAPAPAPVPAVDPAKQKAPKRPPTIRHWPQPMRTSPPSAPSPWYSLWER
ncbi:hypothetical protein [Bifidobacterium aemilianum]|uniref:hypothetical protein n=1 Tax=Bifidobacterium aemilianum TaxID=2493120 RepID=UPI00191C05C1|nr:hypothetical protein [Bifidobacterium aemilianum]